MFRASYLLTILRLVSQTDFPFDFRLPDCLSATSPFVLLFNDGIVEARYLGFCTSFFSLQVMCRFLALVFLSGDFSFSNTLFFFTGVSNL